MLEIIRQMLYTLSASGIVLRTTAEREEEGRTWYTRMGSTLWLANREQEHEDKHKHKCKLKHIQSYVCEYGEHAGDFVDVYLPHRCLVLTLFVQDTGDVERRGRGWVWYDRIISTKIDSCRIRSIHLSFTNINPFQQQSCVFLTLKFMLEEHEQSVIFLWLSSIVK